LLARTDVQHELQDHGAGLAEHAPKVIDVLIALRCLGRCDSAIDGRHQHIIVMVPVENNDLPSASTAALSCHARSGW